MNDLSNVALHTIAVLSKLLIFTSLRQCHDVIFVPFWEKHTLGIIKEYIFKLIIKNCLKRSPQIYLWKSSVLHTWEGMGMCGTELSRNWTEV